MYSANQIKNDFVVLKKWQQVIFSYFEASMQNKDRPFPCLFGVNGYKQNMLRFSFYEEIVAESLQ